MDHFSDEGVVKVAPPLLGSQNEQPHPRFHQQPDRLQKEGVEFNGDWRLGGLCFDDNATG